MFLRSATKVFSVVCWLQKVHSLIYAWENWTGCLLARDINLQLEVNDKWKKKGFWHIGTELLGLCLGAPELLLPFWVPGKAGEFLTGDVSFWGAQEEQAVPISTPRKSQPQISHRLCCLEVLLWVL